MTVTVPRDEVKDTLFQSFLQWY